MDSDPEKFLIAVERGVTGYVLKDASASEVANAIRAVAQGQATCPPTLCRVLFDHVANSASWQPGVQVRQNLGLTRREQQLVQLVSEGLTDKEIATRLYLSDRPSKIMYAECCAKLELPTALKLFSTGANVGSGTDILRQTVV